jgi:hypothetical protein
MITWSALIDLVSKQNTAKSPGLVADMRRYESLMLDWSRNYPWAALSAFDVAHRHNLPAVDPSTKARRAFSVVDAHLVVSMLSALSSKSGPSAPAVSAAAARDPSRAPAGGGAKAKLPSWVVGKALAGRCAYCLKAAHPTAKCTAPRCCFAYNGPAGCVLPCAGGYSHFCAKCGDAGHKMDGCPK